ncbi:DNA alkylation repair protein [Candidatus Peregrinibacteria bacterium CG10_big_fil_rev_8_21_14_0_10_36_19]|nr:MAG: DNA alkylation repair protein [Candidatus Peregrinibacteria bacterium CG10_big_fil_rev_8_21_14_0_10_36_19]
MDVTQLKKDLQAYANQEKAEFFPRFFKTGKGQYAEGDKFIGVTVPNQRKIAKKYTNLPLPEVEKLLRDPIHECRLTALLILIEKYKTSPQAIYDLYIKNLKYINNWDLVDTSAPKILGEYLLENPNRDLLHKLAKSQNLWERRIAIISTQTFIKHLQFDDTIKIATLLLQDTHDLIHKAVGWMLREVGKKDLKTLENFLKKHHKTMPRTALRYAIEHLPQDKRHHYMQS